VTRSIQPAHVGLPSVDVAATLPAVEAREFEERIAALLAAVDVDHVVVNGDREHAGQARHPELRARIASLRSFMRDRLGIDVRDEVLPLSTTPAYFPPFWLDVGRALAFA